LTSETSETSEPAQRQGSVLFTAFEPSGDAHAAPVIAALRELVPGLHIYAWGGPKMEEAGATLLGSTADDGAMGLGAVRRASAVRKEIRRIKRWAREYRVLAHVAVDSPAANFPICKVMQKHGARIIHLVAPQLWAWGGWRARKLRRLTSLVLCLLPFEERWFKQRRIPARFIGHPVVNRELDETALREIAGGFPSGSPRVAILPGSRSQEVKANMRLLADAFSELQGRHSGMSGLIVAANADLARLVRKRIPVFPVGLHMTTARADAAIYWCDLALAVSGTITLDLLRQRKPMVGVYKTGVLSWLLAKIILRTPYRLLPNIIAEHEICPEFVPHAGGSAPIVDAASRLVQDSKNVAVQRESLARVGTQFANKRPADEAARLIVRVLKGEALE
jgi:lipid-A-disaccharide synthase